MGEKWFDQKCKENNPKHDFLFFLSELDYNLIATLLNKQCQQQQYYLQAAIIWRQLYLKAILEHLDNYLEIFNKQPHSKNLIIDALKDDDKIYQTLSELEITRALNKKYPIIPQPLINGKRDDVVISAQNNRRAIFEITSPSHR
jgi:hypothetical protein